MIGGGSGGLAATKAASDLGAKAGSYYIRDPTIEGSVRGWLILIPAGPCIMKRGTVVNSKPCSKSYGCYVKVERPVTECADGFGGLVWEGLVSRVMRHKVSQKSHFTHAGVSHRLALASVGHGELQCRSGPCSGDCLGKVVKIRLMS